MSRVGWAGVLAGAILLAACDRTTAEARRRAIVDLACPAASVTVHPTGESRAEGQVYEASGCGRSFLYGCSTGGRHYGASCMQLHVFRPRPTITVVPAYGPKGVGARTLVVP